MTSKTPKFGGGFRRSTKTPVLGDKKSFRANNITPSRNGDFRKAVDGDRFIPQHNSESMEYAKAMLRGEASKENILNTSSSTPNSPTRYQASDLSVSRGKSYGDLSLSSTLDSGMDMFVYHRQGAPIVRGVKMQNILYRCMNPSSSVRKASTRVYPKAPEQSVDCNDMSADYYYNILDWSSQGLVAVGIKDKVYYFNADTAETGLIADFKNNAINVTSVKFSKDGNYCAVGTDKGFIHLFKSSADSLSDRPQSLRKFGTGDWRIVSAAWASNGVLTFGNRGGVIQTHDTRTRLSFISEMEHHDAEVTSLKWVCDERYLVSGSADASINVYTKESAMAQEPEKLYRFDDHISVVKSISECSFMYGSTIATCGGLNDGTVKLWNLNNGELTNTVNVNGQVAGIGFDPYYREMVTITGQPTGRLNVFKHSAITSNFENVHEIEFNTRPFNMASDPTNDYVAVATDAEEISFFKIFEKDATYISNVQQQRNKMLAMKFSGVRQRIR